ncbi:major facilitator superfamily domain-containing protein 8 [Euwallacea similis]|uniref:major facilitator superfamily domain-containing protein 8 n=1 Tax=Euwallacea similis TaxID=1736056 RepID=UPI0034505DE0
MEKIRQLLKRNNEDFDESLETVQQHRERWRSIYVVYFTMFMMSLGFSIVVTGVWPYLDKLDPTAGKEFMGLIVAANPFGQMLFSPLFGWWSNKFGSIRTPLIFSLLIFTTASSIYSCLELFDSHVKHWMLWSRFLVGVSSANVAACRAYLSAATKYSERTKAVSMISLAQVLGFVVGPAIQMAVVHLGDQGVWLWPKKLRLNMYTATGWINVFLALINIYLFMPHVFREHKIAAKEAMLKQGKNDEKATWKGIKPDYFGAWTFIIAFFVMVFNFMLMETLGTPLTMDQLGWSKDESIWYMGLIMLVCAVFSICTFPLIPIFSKKFSEVKLMIWIGFLLMVLGRISCIPFAGPPPLIYDVDLRTNLSIFCQQKLRNVSLDYRLDYEGLNVTLQTYGRYLLLNSTHEAQIRYMTFDCGDDLLGCPSSQEWCQKVPAITFTQFILCYVLTVLGYPIGITLIQTLFSKVLGSRPQGVWMGLMTGSGCLSRVMGPVFVTHVYKEYGTVWTFGMTSVMMAVSLLWLWYFQKRLEPKDPLDAQNNGVKSVEMELFVNKDGEENGDVIKKMSR